MPDAVHFWFDLADPWSWLACDGVGQLAHDAGRPLIWHPVRLPPATPFTNPARQAALDADLARSAAEGGRAMPRTTVSPLHMTEAMGALYAMAVHDRGRWAEAMFRDLWVHDCAPERRLADVDLSVAAEEAAAAGVFATPSVTVDGQVHWGADRVPFARRAVGLHAGPSPFPRAGEGARVRWFHDFASPFSYLASTQMARLHAESGAAVLAVPILLGALFQALGTPIVPLHTFAPERQRWQLKDMQNWADWWEVPFAFPSTFPLRTVTPLRVGLVESAATEAIYRAAWVEDCDIGDDDVLAGVLTNAGFEASALLAATRDPAIKERLKTNTASAQQRGVCGVPTFEVDGTALIWGQDRLNRLGRCLANPGDPPPP